MGVTEICWMWCGQRLALGALSPPIHSKAGLAGKADASCHFSEQWQALCCANRINTRSSAPTKNGWNAKMQKQ
jgi:hypothetical protein